MMEFVLLWGSKIAFLGISNYIISNKMVKIDF